MTKSTREQDGKQEKIINEFLYEKFFTRRYEECVLIDDAELQKRGCDVLVLQPTTSTYFDMKAQSSAGYINHPRQTFAMEIMFDREGTEYHGWFIRKGMLTDIYCFAWISKAAVGEDGYIHNVDDIEEIELMFISKNKLKAYVESNISYEKLVEQANEMRLDNTQHLDIGPSMYMVYSGHLNERPVNLVIRKNVLNRLAEERYIVRQDGFHKIAETEQK